MESSTKGTAKASGRAATGIWAGLKGDIEINLGGSTGGLGTLLLGVRLLTNPQVRACLLIRLAAQSPIGTGWIWRNMLITLHGIDVRKGATLAPGLRLPHPFGIAIAASTRIGPAVSVGHHVTFSDLTPEGEQTSAPIVIGEGVKIYTNSTFTAGVEVGAGAVVGSHALVTSDVEPGGIVRAHSHH